MTEKNSNMRDVVRDVRKKKVYISGPMRGVENYNRPKFNEWERKIWEGGLYEPVNPMRIGDEIARPEGIERNPELLQKVFNADIRELTHCDAIFLLNGWEKSEGAQKELQYALANGKAVMLESVFLEKEEQYDAKDLSLRMERFANRFGVREDLKRLAIMMTEMHRTLVQSFTGGFVIPFVRELARMRRANCFDKRNETACKVCLLMCEALEKEYGICEGDELVFPMV